MIFSVQIGTMNLGIGLTTASHSAVLLNSYAVHTVVLAHFLIPGDRLTPAKVGGVLVAYAGIVLLFARDFSFRGEHPGRRSHGRGQRGPARGADRVHGARGAAARSAQAARLPVGHRERLLPGREPRLESDISTRYTLALAASLFFQGAVVAGFNFIVNSYLFQVYLASALAICSLTTPLFGVLVAAAITGDQLSPLLLLSSLMVAAGIGSRLPLTPPGVGGEGPLTAARALR